MPRRIYIVDLTEEERTSLLALISYETVRRELKKTSHNWRFSTSDARVKLKRLYPNISESS